MCIAKKHLHYLLRLIIDSVFKRCYTKIKCTFYFLYFMWKPFPFIKNELIRSFNMIFTNPFDLSDKVNDILLIGEILVDKIYINHAVKPMEKFGGSPANVTINLHSLGFKPQFFGAVGNDEYGDYLKNELVTRGIDINNITTFNVKTSIVTIRNINDVMDVTFDRASDYYLYYTNKLETALKKVKILHFSYWPLSKEPSKTTMKKVLDFAKKENIIIGFDPNYHKDLESLDSVGKDELMDIISKVDIIKPSLDDSKRIFGDGYSVEEYIQKYQKLGCKLIIMTLGEDGLVASYFGEIIRIASVAKDVIDVTGAGDAFWSGLYAGILQRESVLSALKIGLICSSYSLKQVGAITNIPNIKYIIKELTG